MGSCTWPARIRNADYDLLAMLMLAYERLPNDREAFLRALVHALEILSRVFPIVDVQTVPGAQRPTEPFGMLFSVGAHGDETRGIQFRWRDAPQPQIWILARSPPSSPSRAWLTTIECVGQAVLSGDAYFAPDHPQWDVADYARWAAGDRPRGQPRPTPPARRATGPSVVTALFPMLECHRRIAGAVGPYWLLPVMQCMLLAGDDPPPQVALTEVPCPMPPSQGVAGGLCVGLPDGCQTRFHWWRRRDWDTHEPLVAFLLFYQCHTLSGDIGDPRHRRDYERRGDTSYPIQTAQDALVVVTVGGVPVATAGLQPNHGGDPTDWYISVLCAVTRSGGGRLLVRHLQLHRRTLWADATGTSVDFYRRMGFAVPDERDPLHVCWRPQ